MALVVADTSPLRFLVEIGCQELLPALYDRVLVPEAVIEELAQPRTPAAVSAAQRQGLELTGTLGVLLQAARRQLIILDDALVRLQATDFRYTPRLLEQVRKSALEDAHE